MSFCSTNLTQTLEKIHKILSAVKDPMADDWDPMELGLLIAKLEYEELNVEDQLRGFQGLVAETAREMPTQGSLHEQVKHVIDIFANRLQFSGDKTNYYNIKNSFMNDVLLRRKGIPITMSLVFMALCRGVGLKAVGISFPGHFLVRVIPSQGHFEISLKREDADEWTQQWFIDCFDGGLLMNVKDCETRLNEWTRGAVTFGPEALKVAHPTEIVSRMLRNLRAIFTEKEDLARLYWVLTGLIQVCPQDAVEATRERGVLMARMGRYAQASQDFRKYLESCKEPDKIAHVERMLRYFDEQTEFPN